jgi:hypothetical protein
MTLAYYFVAYVDLLGQSDELARLKSLPQTEADKAATIAIMKDTAGVVRNVRQSFQEYFETSKTMSPEALKNVPPERKEEFKQIRALKVFHTGFSDSFVIAVPLQVEGGRDPVGLARAVNDLWNALIGLTGLSLIALSQGIALRGGVDIGLGIQIFPNEVYGPVLVSAHRLESQVAEYPRTAVGSGVLDYLAFLEQLPETEPLNRYTATMATRCRDFICAAPDDGCPMLHFLSRHVPAATPLAIPDRRAAENWVRDQIEKYSSNRNEKLARRYARLYRYFLTYKDSEWVSP